MKPALALGLVLAANTLTVDSNGNNELFVAPQGRLADLAKKYPGMIMFDEQADDELYRGNLPREAFKSDEEYRRYIVKRSAEEGDDEFLVRPLIPHISADDELLALEMPREKFIPMTEPIIVTIKIPSWVIANDDEVTDDELLTLDRHSQEVTTIRFPSWTTHVDDEVADDELAFKTPRVFIDRHSAKPVKNHTNEARPHLVKPAKNVTIVRDDEIADAELAFRTPRVFIDRPSAKPAKNHTSEARPHLVKPTKNVTSGALVRDDEADDELVYLAQLLKDQVARPFRGFDDDDEFRVKGEKSAHGKIQEMGTEGPRIKRKLRPAVVDNGSLAQN